MCKNILVDFDGTIVDSKDCWIRTYESVCTSLNKCIDPNTEKQFYQLTFDEWLSEISSELSYNRTIIEEQFIEKAKEIYANRPPKQKCFDIINDYIGCNLYIVSRNYKAIIEHWLKKWNISLFKEIIVENSNRKKKDYYEDVDVLIDDNLQHCKAAKLCKTYVIGINDHHNKSEQSKMKHVCDIYL